MKEYNETQELLYSDVAKAIIDQGNPELLGKYLTQAGQVTPVQELRKIIAYAKKADVEVGGKIMKGLLKSSPRRR
jgi:threonine aldolase